MTVLPRIGKSLVESGLVKSMLVVFLAAGSVQAIANENVLGDLQGVWVPEPVPDELLTVEGARPPLTEEAAAVYERRIELRASGNTYFDQTTWCAGPGMPRIMLMPYPFELVSSADRVAFIHGWYRWHRIVDMGGGEPDIYYPTTMGFPVGQVEGDTLVIRTVGLSEATTLDAAGLPRSEDMILTERIRLLPDGRLENRFTVEDPEVYTAVWEARTTFVRDPNATVGDDICPDRIAQGEPAVAEWQ